MVITRNGKRELNLVKLAFKVDRLTYSDWMLPKAFDEKLNPPPPPI